MKKLTSILVFIVGYINCHSQDFVMINKEKIHYEIKGSGEPWIVLVTGLGMELNEFDSIFYDLSKETTVLRYSRAGNGRSSYNNKRDDFDETVNELELLINELNVPEPFILSGHSYGGLIIRAYAKHNSSKVAGLLSLDPSFEDYYGVLEPFEPEARNIIQSLLKTFYKEFPNRATPHELEAVNMVWNSPERWDEWFSYPSSIPHFLISSLKITDSQLRGTKEIVDARFKAQTKIILNSNINMQIGIVDAGHWVHSDQPQIVIDAFKMLINIIKRS